MLATGNSLPGTPSDSPASARAAVTAATPWLEVIVVITNEREVLIVGTGLTMVDVVLGLRGRVHRNDHRHLAQRLRHFSPTVIFPSAQAILDELRNPTRIRSARTSSGNVFAIRKRWASPEAAVVDALRSNGRSGGNSTAGKSDNSSSTCGTSGEWRDTALPFTIHE